jgi:hypothetical protein
MKYKYIKNLKDKHCRTTSDISKIKVGEKPTFKSKAFYREWCAKSDTDHCFYSLFEGLSPRARIEGENKIAKIYGIVLDFDAPPDWNNIDDIIAANCPKAMPTWRSRTQSGYIRLIMEFEEPLSIDHTLVSTFLRSLKSILHYDKILAGYDSKSEQPSQYFELGTDWVHMGGVISSSIVQTALFKAAKEKPPESTDTSIPIEVIAEEVEKRYPNRWIGDFEVGARGPLFWIDDGIDREGCQVFEDGMIVYSDRDRGWLTWRDIFGPDFVQQFEEQKMGDLLDEYWFNGRQFFKQHDDDTAKTIPRDQLVLELRQRGFKPKPKKGEYVSEVDAAIILISNQNRIDEIAPVVFRRNTRIVPFNGLKILNSATVEPIEPAENGDFTEWPFLNGFFDQFFEDSKEVRTKYYFFAWLQRFYKAFYYNREDQGQACILVGPAKRGKTLLSNKIIASLVGGFADASDYLSGGTKFNKDLGRAACWVIDDTVSAASFADQRKATELIKRGVANPKIQFMAKYADAVTLPWAGRIILSLNDDPNSMSVLPTMDSSNRDKIMAFKVSEKPFAFPPKQELEAKIDEELPAFAKFLMDWKPPVEVLDDDRFGVKSFIDQSISYAAYDNSSRSQVAELIDYFAKACREQNTEMREWRGTITEFQVALHTYNNGRSLGASNKLEFVRNGLSHLEDVGKSDSGVRPIKSIGKGSGKVWIIDVTQSYDIDADELISASSLAEA